MSNMFMHYDMICVLQLTTKCLACHNFSRSEYNRIGSLQKTIDLAKHTLLVEPLSVMHMQTLHA